MMQACSQLAAKRREWHREAFGVLALISQAVLNFQSLCTVASHRKQPGRPLLPPAQAAQEFQLCSHAGTRAKNAAYFESGKTPCGGDEVHMAPFLLCPPSPAQPAAAAGIAAMGSGRCTALRSPIIP